MPPVHLRPTAPLAPRVLLPGDPGRALAIARAVLEAPRMFNHHRGLWGYTGTAPDGEALTVQASGMGGPSTAIVAEELIALGAERIVRTGTCGALDDALGLGDLVVAGEALAEDGASRALGSGPKALADPALAARLGGLAGSAAGAIVSTDLFYAATPDAEADMRARWRGSGARAVEMDAAALFTVARLRGASAAAVLAVTELVAGPEARERIGDEALAAAERRLGEVAAAALAD